tara:strand:+ start:12017 stop:12943 length:927 start_codon:yes stop_codon:yes gene_type:complete
MSTKIKIKFVDFWKGFDPEDNWFYHFLSERFAIELSDDPDFLFYSSYSHSYLKYSCKRIFFSAENIRANFYECDYALSFDFIERINHLRLPLYVIWDKLDPSYLLNPEYLESIKTIKKSKFCCIVVSNGKSQERINFFEKLCAYKKVDSGGGFMNNIGEMVKDKLSFIKDYKFTIAFENSSFPGYVTEKVYQPMFTNTIPIYWGSSMINEDFNTERILWRGNFKSDEELINKIIELDTNDELYQEFISRPCFVNNELTKYFDSKRIEDFFKLVFNDSSKPLAKTWKKFIGIIIRKTRSYHLKKSLKKA